MTRRLAASLAGGALLLGACALPVSTTFQRVPPAEPTAQQMAEFWVEPEPGRDLFWGAGGRENAPDPQGRWTFVERDSTGYSRGFDVTDERGIKWSAKVGEEAQSEVVSSRLMWAVGFHQPPVYYVPSWTLSGDTGWAGHREPARFRPELPALKPVGEWPWQRNPFVDTQPWRGALVMMLLINNPDLKPSQNTVYDLDPPRGGVRRWYVVRDLGLSLGETAGLWARRNDIDEFEKEPFITGTGPGGRVKFHHSGRWKSLFRDLTAADVRWTCERLARLTPRQWDDVFRAAGYREDVARRYIRRFQEKIAQGLALPQGG
ncbi:MAG TPA: hypothetical protein VFO85_07650 [Vicinamibacteria bacterium]|nr:hypothetical protein [Vicinamibacteria bacterium]